MNAAPNEDSDEGLQFPCEHAPRVYREDYEAMRRVVSLMKLADAGDERALRALHKLTAVVSRFLNEKHDGFAASVLEWPVMIPREKSGRDKCLQRASSMRIGGVKGGGTGRPDKLTGGSQKGFALLVLEQVVFVRALVRSIGVPALRNELAQALDQIGIADCSHALSERIGELDDYCPTTRRIWIDVACDLLLANRALIPPSIACAATDETFEFDAKGVPSKRVDAHARGLRAALFKALSEGLSKVCDVPRGAR